MKKLLTVMLMGLMLALFACPKEEEAPPPPPPEPASAPAEPPKPVEPEPKTPEEAKAKAEINEINAADQAKAIEMELDKDIEEAKKLGEETK
ncbi:MAG: hypothetical protein ABIJ09_27095 [Pseudomonadota bacterium]